MYTICITQMSHILQWFSEDRECLERGGCSSQHLIIPTRLAQLRLHKATHRGIFLNAKDAFSCHKKNVHGVMGMRVWERSLFHRADSGWIEWGCVACVTLACSQSRGTGSGQWSWEDTSPPLFVCIKPLLDSSFKWTSKHRPLWQRAWRDMSQDFSAASLSFNWLDCMQWTALWFSALTAWTSTSLSVDVNSDSDTIHHGR